MLLYREGRSASSAKHKVILALFLSDLCRVALSNFSLFQRAWTRPVRFLSARNCHSLSTSACASTAIPTGVHEVRRVNSGIELLIGVLSWAGVFGFVSGLISGAIG